jgi:hypothetical protein
MPHGATVPPGIITLKSSSFHLNRPFIDSRRLMPFSQCPSQTFIEMNSGVWKLIA